MLGKLTPYNKVDEKARALLQKSHLDMKGVIYMRSDTLHLNGNKPMMIAHRGASGLEVENTCAAFVAAGNRSYHGIETDVHVTKDGKYIIIHDDNTERIAGDKLIVEETTYETLRGIHLLDKDGIRGRSDLVLANLSEYSSICKKYNKYSVLELKNHMEKEHVKGIIDCVHAVGWLEKTIFISFDLPNLVAMRELLPMQPAQYLYMKVDDTLIPTLKQYNLDLDMYYKSVNKDFIEKCHAENIKVNVWTPDTLEECSQLAQWGVDYITSNIVE